jgi:hypothetical protein
MFVLLWIGALVVALTLAPIRVDARNQDRGPTTERQLLLPYPPCAWDAAMLAKQTQANGTSYRMRCGGARACR